MGPDARAPLEIRDKAISVGIAAAVQVLSALTVGAIGGPNGLFTESRFTIVFLVIPAAFLGTFSLYVRQQRYSVRPVIAHAVLSAIFTFIHFLFWASRSPAV